MNLFKGSWRKKNKETGSNSESEKRGDKIDTLKTHKRGIETKEKKFKECDLRSKKRAKVQVKSSESSQRTNEKGVCLVATYDPLLQNIGRIFRRQDVFIY